MNKINIPYVVNIRDVTEEDRVNYDIPSGHNFIIEDQNGEPQGTTKSETEFVDELKDRGWNISMLEPLSEDEHKVN